MSWALGILVGLLSFLVVVVLLVAAVVAQLPWLAGMAAVAPIAVVAPQPAISIAAAPAVPGPIPTPLAASSSDLVERTIADAMTWLGVPYRWAGCTRAGVDCSCFIDNILLVGAGIRAPRVTIDQIRWATPVPAGSMRRGDLLFFHDTCTGCGANPTHVAMYLGGGQFIHAGDPVQISSVTSALFREHFQAVGRPIGF